MAKTIRSHYDRAQNSSRISRISSHICWIKAIIAWPCIIGAWGNRPVCNAMFVFAVAAIRNCCTAVCKAFALVVKPALIMSASGSFAITAQA